MTKTAELRRAGVSDSGPPSTTDSKLTSSWKTFFFSRFFFSVMGTATKDALILFMFAETQINSYHESCIFKIYLKEKTSSCNSLLEFLNHRDAFNIFLKRHRAQCARESESWLWVQDSPLCLWCRLLIFSRSVPSLHYLRMNRTDYHIGGFPGSSVVKESACSIGYPGSIPGLGRSPGEGNGNPLQH